MKVADRPAWLRRESITDSHRRSSALAEHVRRLVEEGGETMHAASGDSMAHIISELESRKIRYTIDARPGFGYLIITRPPVK